MTHRGGFRRSRDHGTLLATFFTIMGGVLFCSLFLAAFSDQDIATSVGSVFALGLFAMILAWRMRERSLNLTLRDCFFWVAPRRYSDPFGEYTPRRRARPQRFGTNSPPTAERVRQIASDHRVWIPRRGR